MHHQVLGARPASIPHAGFYVRQQKSASSSKESKAHQDSTPPRLNHSSNRSLLRSLGQEKILYFKLLMTNRLRVAEHLFVLPIRMLVRLSATEATVVHGSLASAALFGKPVEQPPLRHFSFPQYGLDFRPQITSMEVSDLTVQYGLCMTKQIISGRHPRAARSGCIISIGAGVPPLKATGDQGKRIIESLVKIALDTQQIAESFADEMRHLSNATTVTYVRLNVGQGTQDIGLEEWTEFEKLTGATNHYLNNCKPELEVCANALRDLAGV